MRHYPDNNQRKVTNDNFLSQELFFLSFCDRYCTPLVTGGVSCAMGIIHHVPPILLLQGVLCASYDNIFSVTGMIFYFALSQKKIYCETKYLFFLSLGVLLLRGCVPPLVMSIRPIFTNSNFPFTRTICERE